MEMCHQQNWSHGKQYQGCREEELAIQERSTIRWSKGKTRGELWHTMEGSSFLIIDIEVGKGHLSFKLWF